MTNGFLLARVFALAVLLLGSLAVTSFGDGCDNFCRIKFRFYFFTLQQGGTTRVYLYNYKECFYCVGNNACFNNEPSLLAQCDKDTTVTNTVTYYSNGTAACSEYDGTWQRSVVEAENEKGFLKTEDTSFRYLCKPIPPPK